MRANTVNIKSVYMIELIGPNFDDFHFKLKFYGETPGGKRLDAIVEFPAWGVSEIAHRLHEVQKGHERHVANGRDALEKNE